MEATKSLKRERYLFWILVGGLLFLRFPWIILGKALAPAYGAGIVVVFEVGTYLLTALLVFLERKRLAEYHIDSLALVLLLGAPVVILIGSKTGGYALPGQGIKALFASVLLIALLIWRPVLPKRGAAQTAIYLGAAVLIGGALAIVSGFLLSFQVQNPLDLSRFPSAGRLRYEALYQLDYAAAAEEPLFRGFLWGGLRRCGWKDHWIWLFQALLFAVGHVYYVGVYNISAFLVVPLAALVLGLAAWKTRSIGTSMIVHGITNGFGNALVYLFCGLLR